MPATHAAYLRGTMKRSLPFLLVGLPLLMSGCTVQTEVHFGDDRAKPRLVVGITVDQMRADYLTRFGAWDEVSSPATFGEGGFRRMVE